MTTPHMQKVDRGDNDFKEKCIAEVFSARRCAECAHQFASRKLSRPIAMDAPRGAVRMHVREYEGSRECAVVWCAECVKGNIHALRNIICAISTVCADTWFPP